MRVDVVHGPNLNLLGTREPGLYGREGLAELERRLRARWPELEWSFFQSNHEGALIDRLQAAPGRVDGLVLNPGGLAHTSVALLDALRGLDLPVVEVHLTHVLGREAYRHTLLSAQGAVALVSGMGMLGYEAAVEFLLRRGAA